MNGAWAMTVGRCVVVTVGERVAAVWTLDQLYMLLDGAVKAGAVGRVAVYAEGIAEHIVGSFGKSVGEDELWL